MSLETAGSERSVEFIVAQLRGGYSKEQMLADGHFRQAEVVAAEERISTEREHQARRRAKEIENEARGGVSCRECSGFVAAENVDRFGSPEDGYPPPYCGACWPALEAPLLRDRLNRAGVPVHFLEAVLSAGRGAPYSRPPGKCFTLIVGPVGVGKTFRAVQLLLDVREGKFWSLPDLVEARRTAWFSRGDNRPTDPVPEVASYRRLLVLDEVGGRLDKDGKPDEKELVIETFRYIVAHRYDHRLPTVLTSNWTLDQIEKGYGEKVGSRLSECAHVVEMKETRDRRREPRKYVAALRKGAEPER